MLMSVLSGIIELKELTMKDCSREASPALLDEDEKAKLGIKERFRLAGKMHALNSRKVGLWISFLGTSSRRT